MKIFISGTDTNIGKTVIASWITLHTGFSYFKPIQSGAKEDSDTLEVKKLAHAKTYPETYSFQEPLSPHLAARLENTEIDLDTICLPSEHNLIIEGAGGLLVPINSQYLVIDLIKKFEVPVILVSRASLGTINHTLLSLEVLRARHIKILGVIMNGESNPENKAAIEFYGNIPVLAEFPKINEVNYDSLYNIALPDKLIKLLMD